MTALDMVVRELSVDEMDEVSGGARAAAVAFLVGVGVAAAERYVFPFFEGMYEGFTDDE